MSGYTGGRLLHPQEIRACISHGAFIDLLGKLNDIEPWRSLYGPKSERLKDQELILRFFALYYDAERYSAPMKHFLDSFVNANGNLNRLSAAELTKLFSSTMGLVSHAIGPKAFRPVKAFNAAAFDAISVGLARRLSRGDIKERQQIKERYDQLINDPKFVDSYVRATAREENVRTRLELATTAFANIP